MTDDEIQALKDEIENLRIDNKELNDLFNLQYKRCTIAWDEWREANNEPDTIPDLGELIEWLRSERDNACERGVRDAANHIGSKCFCDPVKKGIPDHIACWWCGIEKEILTLIGEE